MEMSGCPGHPCKLPLVAWERRAYPTGLNVNYSEYICVKSYVIKDNIKINMVCVCVLAGLEKGDMAMKGVLRDRRYQNVF